MGNNLPQTQPVSQAGQIYSYSNTTSNDKASKGINLIDAFTPWRFHSSKTSSGSNVKSAASTH